MPIANFPEANGSWKPLLLVLLVASRLLFLIDGAAAAHERRPVAEPRRVLLLHSFGPHFAPWKAIAGGLREELIKQSPYPIDLYEAALQGNRFGPVQDQGPFIE